MFTKLVFAGMAELVDAADLKSAELIARTGSIPVPGILKYKVKNIKLKLRPSFKENFVKYYLTL